jgi:hypothetical protein
VWTDSEVDDAKKQKDEWSDKEKADFRSAVDDMPATSGVDMAVLHRAVPDR